MRRDVDAERPMGLQTADAPQQLAARGRAEGHERSARLAQILVQRQRTRQRLPTGSQRLLDGAPRECHDSARPICQVPGFRFGSLLQQERAVADDPVPGPGRITAGAQIELPHRQIPLAGEGERAAQRIAPAGIVVGDPVDGQTANRLGRAVILRRGRAIGQVVGQIGGHHEDRAGHVERIGHDLGDMVAVDMPHDHRHQSPARGQHALQERHLHLQAVFPSVRHIVHHDGAGELLLQPGHFGRIDGDLAQRGPPRRSAGRGHRAQRHEVRGPDQQHPRHRFRQQPVRRGRDRPGVDVACVGHDHPDQLGGLPRSGIGEQGVHLRAQDTGVGLVEHAGHRRWTDPISGRDGAHGATASSCTGCRLRPQLPAGPSKTPGIWVPQERQRP